VVETELTIQEEVISPDGVPKLAYVLNGQMPGPTIEANVQDILRIKVTNQAKAAATSVHWHGISQIGSFYMDGASGVTQCPIPPGSSFVYEFLLDEPGTFWYHSHQGVQYGDGLLGPLLVHVPTEPEERGYARDFVLLLQDWFHVSGEYVDFLKKNGLSTPRVDSVLINGRGVFNCSDYHPPSSATSLTCQEASELSYEVFEAQPGERIRFRFINGAAGSSFSVSVDGHKMLAFAADGRPFKEVEVDYIDIQPGERYDVLVSADQKVDNYWIRSSLAGVESMEAKGSFPFLSISSFL